MPSSDLIERKEESLANGELPVTKFASVDAVVFEALCLAHPRAHYKTGRVEVLDGGWNLGPASWRRLPLTVDSSQTLRPAGNPPE